MYNCALKWCYIIMFYTTTLSCHICIYIVLYYLVIIVIRHSPPGMPYGFVRFFFFRRHGFRMITFEWQGGSFRNFRGHGSWSKEEVYRFQTSATPRWGVARPQTPQNLPHPPFFVLRFRTPGTFFEKQNV